MCRELSRSTLYSSSCPSSRSATRRSSFSTLITNLLPVLRGERPRIRFTLSIIGLEKIGSHGGISRAIIFLRSSDGLKNRPASPRRGSRLRGRWPSVSKEPFEKAFWLPRLRGGDRLRAQRSRLLRIIRHAAAGVCFRFHIRLPAGLRHIG